MKFGNRFIIFSLIILILSACNQNPLLVDISNSPVKVDFVNVDSIYKSSTSSEDFKRNHDYLKKVLGELYLYEVSMNLKENDTNAFPEGLRAFYSSEYVRSIEDEKNSIQENIGTQKNTVQDAFKYFNVHFPSAPIPVKIAFMNKMFSNIHSSDECITVGLENYLGPENEVIKGIPSDQLFQWQKEAMNISFLSRDILLSWIQAHLFEEKDETLAEHIVQAGKVLYVLKSAFPESSDAYILRYTDEDYQWAIDNELPFWDYIVKEELLFDNNPRDKANLLNEGPYTIGLPEKGPDRLGQFLGFQMVNQFMEQNKELPLQELLTVDYNKILQSYEID